MKEDRPRLQQNEIAFFIGRDVPERMKRAMRGFLHGFERNKANVVKGRQAARVRSEAAVRRAGHGPASTAILFRVPQELRLSKTKRVPVYARSSFIGSSAFARSVNGSPEQ